MRKLMTIMMVGLSALVLTGCGGNSHEALANESFDVMEEMMDTVIAADDMDAAKAKLQSLSSELKSIAEKAKDLPKLTKEEAIAFGEKMKTRGEAMAKKAQEAMAKFMKNPELMKIYQEAMMNMAALNN